jgi:pyruvate ferredoxin oxidoreductase beta subunit
MTGFAGATPDPEPPARLARPVSEANRKNLTDIMIAHELGYVAQASPHDPRDLVRKSAKALDTPGATFINGYARPRGWRADSAETIDRARAGGSTGRCSRSWTASIG